MINFLIYLTVRMICILWLQEREILQVLILVLTAIIVVVIKTFYKHGTPLEGGMPSGHSAIGFATFGIIMFMTSDIRIQALGLFMALLVAQSKG